jgi:hypothetical protein
MLSKGEATKLIEGEAERREHKLGWRLLMSPWSTLSSARSAIITMNPGTPRDSAKRPSVIEWEVPRLSVEQGSAYRLESWWNMPQGTAPLQRQLLRLIEIIGEQPDDILAGNLVPFASRSWNRLKDSGRAVTFGVDLWRKLLDPHRPERIFVLGGPTYRAFKAVVRADRESTYPSGWGQTRLRRSSYEGGVLIGLPHLSRFKLLGQNDRETLFREAAAL